MNSMYDAVQEEMKHFTRFEVTYDGKDYYVVGSFVVDAETYEEVTDGELWVWVNFLASRIEDPNYSRNKWIGWD